MCRFPGPPASYGYAVDMIDVDLLVEAEEWLATHVKPDTANTSFNITNGDVTRWKHVRRHMAHYLSWQEFTAKSFSARSCP